MALAAAVAGCGGGGEERLNVSEAEVRELVVRGFGATDPATCRGTITQNFAEQRSGEEGEEAFETCEAVGRRPALDLKSAVVEIRTSDENSLIAAAELVGGTFDGSLLIVSIVSEDGTAKVDAITDADIQRRDYERYAREELVDEGIPDTEIDCVIDGYEKEVSDDQIDELVASGSADIPDAQRVFVKCLTPGSKRSLLAEAMRRAAEDADEDPAVIGCAVERIRGLPGRRAERLFDDARQAEVLALFEQTSERCAFAADPDAEA